MDFFHDHQDASRSEAGRETQRADHYNGEPNAALMTHVLDMTPGRALDLGCGTGADAIWLASKGWTVTAVDISESAIDRARRAGGEAGVTVDWICRDFVEQPPPKRSFDLVTAFYPALLRSAGDDGVESLVRGVIEGGTLLVVGHGPAARESQRSRGFDQSRYMEPSDIAARLDKADWEIQIPLPTDSSEPAGNGHDVVFRARRRTKPAPE